MNGSEETYEDGIYLFTSICEDLSKDENFIDINNPRAYLLSRIIPVLTFVVWTACLIYEINESVIMLIG